MLVWPYNEPQRKTDLGFFFLRPRLIFIHLTEVCHTTSYVNTREEIVQGAKEAPNCCSGLSAVVLHRSGSGQHYMNSSDVGAQGGFPYIITTGTFLDDLYNQLRLLVKKPNQNQAPTPPKSASATPLPPYKSIHHVLCECE